MVEESGAPSTRELAARVAGRADIADLRLVRSATNVERIPAQGEPLSWDLTVTPSIEDLSDVNRLVLTVSFAVTITGAETDTDDDSQDEAGLVGTIECTFAGLYSLGDEPLEPPPAEEELHAFAMTSGIMGLYPYARHFVQDMTSRAGLPALVMGLWKISVETAEQLRNERA